MPYLQINPENGKWYISEGFKANIRPETPYSRDEMCAHNQGAHKMILAGPFETKEEASSQLHRFQDYIDPFVWLRE